MAVEINCDMGEGFGIWRLGDDEGLMPLITAANVACGYHASDPDHMRASVRLAARHGVRVGAHVSLPDLQGFGRRAMAMGRDEVANATLYQIGALKAFLDAEGMAMAHLKPHGALYGMAAREAEIAHGIADAAEVFGLPVLGLAGTLHEEVYGERGLDFRAEFFADLEYDDDGSLVITRRHAEVAPADAAARAKRAAERGVVRSIGGHDVAVRADTICVHSDTPNAVEVARAVRDALRPLMAA
jgi:UPF0271 protein